MQFSAVLERIKSVSVKIEEGSSHFLNLKIVTFNQSRIAGCILSTQIP
jgi:hypothetical protein